MEDLVQVRIKNIRKTTFKVLTNVYDGWMDRRGVITSNESHHHVERALEIIAEADRKLVENGREPHYMNDFLESNKNKGYDAGEFLVVVFGYIAIEGKKAIYNCGKNGTTSMQRKAIGVKWEDGVLIDDKINVKKERESAKERQWVVKMASFYSDWRNQFHCPSGTPRASYLEWKELANKYGVCTSTRRTYFTSY